MKTVGRIDVTDVDLRELVRAAYRLSVPQGLGFLHARDGELDDETCDAILARGKVSSFSAVSMDYVHGRAVKMHVHRVDDRLWIGRRWFDHSRAAFELLLQAIGLSPDLIDKAELAWLTFLDSESAIAVQYVSERDGQVTERFGLGAQSEDEAFIERHLEGFHAACDRGLLVLDPQTHLRLRIWRLAAANAGDAA